MSTVPVSSKGLYSVCCPTVWELWLFDFPLSGSYKAYNYVHQFNDLSQVRVCAENVFVRWVYPFGFSRVDVVDLRKLLGTLYVQLVTFVCCPKCIMKYMIP